MKAMQKAQLNKLQNPKPCPMDEDEKVFGMCSVYTSLCHFSLDQTDLGTSFAQKALLINPGNDLAIQLKARGLRSKHAKQSYSSFIKQYTKKPFYDSFFLRNDPEQPTLSMANKLLTTGDFGDHQSNVDHEQY